MTPHHFSLTDDDVAAATYDPNWKTDPPLRQPPTSRPCSRRSTTARSTRLPPTTHLTTATSKELDFSEAPSGIVGLETAVSLALDRLVHGKVIGLGQLVRLLSTGPAEVFGLPGGTLRPGSPADVTVLDLRRRVTVDPASLPLESAQHAFRGLKLRGAPVATIVGGRIVWRADG